MKKILYLVCVLTLILGSVAARAETTGVYVAPKFLMMWQNNDSNMENKVNASLFTETYEASSFNSQFTLGGALAVGYDFYPQYKLPIRAELEFAMRGDNKFSADTIDVENGNTTSQSKFLTNASTLMANFFYDFHNDSAFTPYVTAGAGLAFIRSEYSDTNTSNGEKFIDVSENFTNFAWNVGAGVAWNFNENIAVDLGYRYVNMGNVSISWSRQRVYGLDSYDIDTNLANHEVALGIRYTF